MLSLYTGISRNEDVSYGTLNPAVLMSVNKAAEKVEWRMDHAVLQPGFDIQVKATYFHVQTMYNTMHTVG
jgi:hypothetical protein